MKKYRFETALAVVLALLCAIVWKGLTPGAGGKLTREEVDAYLQQIGPHTVFEPAEKAEFLARLRAWGEADDGEPVYMLNLMRYYEHVKQVPGTEAIEGTPEQANDLYEDRAIPMLLRLGGYPVIAGEAAGVRGSDGRPHTNLMEYEPALDDWSRALIVRYPNRRAFFDLIRNPDYLKVMPYKVASVLVALIPLKAEVVVPDPRVVFMLVALCLFFAVAWLRAMRPG